MFVSRRKDSKVSVAASVLHDDDTSSILDDADVDAVDVSDVDVDEVPAQKPHFLDYDAVPPPDFEENFDRVLTFGIGAKPTKTTSTEPSATSGEQLKMDKKYERDGEISDYELAASGYTKKEFTQDDNTLNLTTIGQPVLRKSSLNPKPKHFLDENPIPPDYMLEHELREHRSLDRNFERHHEQRTESPSSLGGSGSGGGCGGSGTGVGGGSGGRKSSLDRASSGSRSSRERFKEPSYTLSRFLDSDSQMHTNPSASLPQHCVPKGGAWTDSFDSRYGSLQLPSVSGDVDTLGPKVECVYSLLSMLGSNDPLEMSKKFLELSRTTETCATLRRSGCIPLLVQMMHSENDENVRKWAGMALHNVVHSHPDEKAGRREAKVLRLLDQIIDYCSFLKTLLQSGGEAIADDSDRHPLAAISSLMKVSFDEEHRHAMCELGALQAIPSLVHLDHAVHGPKPEDQCCNSLRRYALMALTNLTFGDENNKALLCSQKLFMEALVSQLDSAPDDLLQVTASVLRNLSWRADSNMKAVLNEIGTVTALTHAAMKNKNENTLKAILSALWNLSAHCSTNKAEFCAVDGALAFLVDMLNYEGPSKTLKIIENAGGILRNVSSHIAVREHYRQILREHNCLAILLQQLKSESLTVVSNSCGTLWNLSARCPEDQKFLWDNGAVPMLRSLIHSKHAMISEGSSSALKNLLNFRPSIQNQTPIDPITRSMGLKKLPTLNVRKQKALELELGGKEHAETCDNLDMGPSGGSISKERSNYDNHLPRRYPASAGVVATSSSATTTTIRLTRSAMLTKSESRDSVFSAKSDSAYENVMRSHSASDANRKPNGVAGGGSFATVVHTVPRASFDLENDVEPTEEEPIDYSVKYNENEVIKVVDDSPTSGQIVDDDDAATGTSNYTTYQETDLDQPTDFSLRYAENQIEMDAAVASSNSETAAAAANKPATANNGNEILLILEDSVKCYQTEDTPYVISNAASVTDLRQNKMDNIVVESVKSTTVTNVTIGQTTSTTSTKRYHRTLQQQATATAFTPSESYTPEKPINYCEEGTPGYFSRYESLSSLDESPPQVTAVSANSVDKKEEASFSPRDEGDVQVTDFVDDKSVIATTTSLNQVVQNDPVSCTNVNSALETPLMFSRHSSMDSLAEVEDEEDVGPLDDKSSVVSDFSRLASGVISPSEIPDSPSQSMPQSPRRNSTAGQAAMARGGLNVNRSGVETKRPLRSVFEDDLNTFHVENTPAQFSCATSLSNLSIVDDENASATSKCNDVVTTAESVSSLQGNVISEGEEEESVTNNDDLLLASCINMGMNRSAGAHANVRKSHATKLPNSANSAINPLPTDEPKQYFTEDTPALLSKVGSNTNLSAISICSSNHDILDQAPSSLPQRNVNRDSLNLSDDISSNASENGTGGAQSFDLLQQCIRDGMKKTPSTSGGASDAAAATRSTLQSKPVMDPIAMMRRGGNMLPPYLPVRDEMSKYLVEDSPCNFSIASGLSNLTVGSSLVGPAVKLRETTSNKRLEKENPTNDPLGETNGQDTTLQLPTAGEDVRREQQWQDDSLSSLSIDSEDDTNLLSQAIAAGCNRPKSNLGFSSTSTNKRSTSLSASQPIPINSATSASSLTLKGATTRHGHTKQSHNNGNGNESYSSVDSSDSNDNQSKSLFELCILTGMHKTGDTNSVRRPQQLLGSRGKYADASSTQSNPNLKQFDSSTTSQNGSHSKQPVIVNRHIRERERKDEKLLLECINTGISKKIVHNTNHENSKTSAATQSKSRELVFAANAVPKNVLATSAAASELYHRTEAITSPNVNITAAAAAPDVEKNTSNSTSTIIMPTTSTKENVNQNVLITNTNTNIINREDITDDQRNLRRIVAGENRQNLAIVRETMNDTGSNREEFETPSEMENSISLSNTTSDESNESFIMETTVSLESAQRTEMVTFQKHKDPDLMLKSVERLTLEFVSSAEQLRTHGSSNDSNENNQQRCGSNSNNTWNEDTCPNDVSFPSVSISAPIVASLKSDYDDEEEQPTEADHREICDFAEITPTNEEQPQSSLGFMCDDDVHAAIYLNTTQPNSLETETETETLINDANSKSSYSNDNNITSSSTSGINFKLGGQVQSAAAAIMPNGRHMFFNNSMMTQSTIIAIEARALADNLVQTDRVYNDANTDDDDDNNTELTFSINSLDLDNIRPPSGMESLNISGYFQPELSPPVDQHSQTQPNSLKNSINLPQFLTKSPKFPRKTLPAGLVARRALGHLPGHLSTSAESVNSSCNLLDNIKPPSLMDELLDSMISVASIQSEVADCESMATTVSAASNYETAAAGGGNDGFDDNTVTLQSCYENAMPHDDDGEEEEDKSGGTATQLSDSDFSSAETTPKTSAALSGSGHGVKRSLTPKQKRKIAKDRFKTYTIVADDVPKIDDIEQQPDETLAIEITEPATSTNDRASTKRSQDRYKTQTIIYPTQIIAPEDVPQEECPSEEISSIRAMVKNFKFITSPPPAVANTNNVDEFATALTTNDEEEQQEQNSVECDQNSETESCHEMDATCDRRGGGGGEVEGCDEESKETDAVGGEKGSTRPRIVKTDAVEQTKLTQKDANDEEATKAIRGRKKQPYISPYSMQFQRGSTPASRSTSRSKANAPPTTAAAAAIRKSKPNVPVSPPNSTSKMAQKKKTKEISEATPTSPAQNSGLERQGTFVKDEPSATVPQVPIVEATASVQSSPTRSVSKLPLKRKIGGITKPTTTTTTTTTARKALGAAAAAAAATNLTKVNTKSSLAKKLPVTAATATQRSNSNASIRVTSAAVRTAVLSSRVSNTTPPSRSNSNLNCSNNTTTTTATPTTNSAQTKINQAQSRIAGIWKRIDDVKNKQQIKSAGTVGTNLRTPPTKPHAATASATASSKHNMIRSSTFDNSPEAMPSTSTVVVATSKIAISRNNINGIARNETLTHQAKK